MANELLQHIDSAIDKGIDAPIGDPMWYDLTESAMSIKIVDVDDFNILPSPPAPGETVAQSEFFF